MDAKKIADIYNINYLVLYKDCPDYILFTEANHAFRHTDKFGIDRSVVKKVVLQDALALKGYSYWNSLEQDYKC